MSSKHRDGVVVRLYSFFNLDARWMCVVFTPRPLYPREKDGTHSTGGLVNATAGLEWGRKNLHSRRLELYTVQALVKCHTDYASNFQSICKY